MLTVDNIALNSAEDFPAAIDGCDNGAYSFLQSNIYQFELAMLQCISLLGKVLLMLVKSACHAGDASQSILSQVDFDRAGPSLMNDCLFGRLCLQLYALGPSLHPSILFKLCNTGAGIAAKIDQLQIHALERG